MENTRTKTVLRKITRSQKLVIDTPGGPIEITACQTVRLTVKLPPEYAWREEKRENVILTQRTQ